MKFKMAWGDFIVIALVLALGLGGVFYNIVSGAGHDHLYVQIYVENELYKEISLEDNKDRVVTVPVGPEKESEAEVEIKDGKVRMLPIDEELCPRGICSHTGWISNYGESIACMPNRILIVFEKAGDDSGDDIDGVTF